MMNKLSNWFNQSIEAPTVDAFEAARTAAWASNDADEGRTAFLEKRVANFTAS